MAGSMLPIFIFLISSKLTPIAILTLAIPLNLLAFAAPLLIFHSYDLIGTRPATYTARMASIASSTSKVAALNHKEECDEEIRFHTRRDHDCGGDHRPSGRDRDPLIREGSQPVPAERLH